MTKQEVKYFNDMKRITTTKRKMDKRIIKYLNRNKIYSLGGLKFVFSLTNNNMTKVRDKAKYYHSKIMNGYRMQNRKQNIKNHKAQLKKKEENNRKREVQNNQNSQQYTHNNLVDGMKLNRHIQHNQ